MAFLGMFDRNASGGDLVTGFRETDALVAGRSVVVADVASQCASEGFPVEVVGVVDVPTNTGVPVRPSEETSH